MGKLKFLAFIFIVAATLFSCDVGLGSAVDTQAPLIEITYPPVSAKIQKTFTLYGTCSDDQGVSSISVSVKRVSDKKVFYTGTAAADEGGKSWSTNLNLYDKDTGSYTLPDGTFEVSVYAKDSAGHSSAVNTRIFDIDNTAPVLVLNKPLSVGQESPVSYGRVLKLAGDVSDDHTVTLDLLVKGAVKNGATLSADEKAELVRVENLSVSSMSSDSPLVVAKYFGSEEDLDEEKTKLQKNYYSIYGDVNTTGTAGDSLNETKYFYCGIVLRDDARVYDDPANENGSGEGNVTDRYYLNTDSLSAVLSSFGTDGLKASDIKKILNGTTSLDDASVKKVKAALEADGNFVECDSEKDTPVTEKSNVFQMDPDNYPSWSIGSYAVGTENNSYADETTGFRTYSLNGNLTLTISPNSDKDYVVPQNVSLYYIQIVPDSLYVNWTENGEPVYLIDASGEKANQWTDTATNEAASYNFAIDGLPANKFYKFVLEGEDRAENTFVAASEGTGASYGFQVASSGQPPEITFSSQTKSFVNAITSHEIEGKIFTESAEWDDEPLVAAVEVYSGIISDTDSAELIAKGGTGIVLTEEEKAEFKFEPSVNIEYIPETEGGDYKTEKNPSWKITLGGTAPATPESYTYVITLTANSSDGRTVEKFFVYYDSLVPSLKSFSVAGKIFVTETAGEEAVNPDTTWFKDTGLKVAGTFAEYTSQNCGSGIDSVYYWLNPDKNENVVLNDINKASGFFSVKNLGEDDNWCSSFDSSISGFDYSDNYLYFVAVDKAGNRSTTAQFIIHKDNEASEVNVTSGTFGDTSFTAAGTVLTGGTNDMTLEGTWSDNASGFGSITLTLGTKNLDAVIAHDEKTWTATGIKASDLGTGGDFKVKMTDIAGNSTSSITAFKLVVDKTAPSVKINTYSAAGTTVNGTITISGTAEDYLTESDKTSTTVTGTLANVKVYYALSETAPALSSAEWKQIDTNDTYATTDSRANWSVSRTVSSATQILSSDTTGKISLADSSSETATLWVKAVATDAAGNSLSSDIVKLLIDRNADRPVINISSLEKAESWLKNSTMNGSVSDDDGVEEFKIQIVKEDDTPAAWSEVKAIALSGGTWKTSEIGEDGNYDVYFYIKDSAGPETVFETPLAATSDSAKNIYMRPLVKYNSETTASDNSVALSLQKDTQIPVVGAALISVASSAAGLKTADTISATDDVIDTTKSAGGTNAWFKVFVPVTDAYVDGATVTLKISDSKNTDVTNLFKYENGESVGTSIALTKTGTYFESAPISVAGYSAASGQYSLSFTAKDPAENEQSKNFLMTLDNTAPTVTVQSPSVSDEVTGNITVRGICDDGSGGSGVSSIYWFIPTKDQINLPDSDFVPGSTSIKNGSGNATKIASAWQFDFDGISNIKISDLVPDSIASGSDNDYATNIDGTNLWTVPIYLRVEDKIGNATVLRNFALRYNPDGDKPTAEILLPEPNKEGSGDTYSVAGKNIRITGSAADNVNVESVFLQFAVGTKADDTADVVYNSFSKVDFKTLVENGGATWFDLADDSASATDVTKDNADYVFYDESSAGIKTGNSASDWWAVKATGKTSWYCTINSNGELSAQNSTDNNTVSYIKVRACSVDNNGKVGEWSNSVSLWIDKKAPSINSARLVNLGETVPSDIMNAAVLKERDYASGLYVKGLWYLELSVTDDTSVTSINVSTEGTGGQSFTLDNGDDNKYSSVSTVDSNHSYTLRLPVSSVSGTGETSYTVSAVDNESHTTTLNYTVYFDNEAPTIGELRDSSTEKAIKMTKIANSNNVYTFGGTLSDTGAGFKRLAFYFLRNGTIELPLVKQSESGSGWVRGTASKHTATSLTKDTDSGLYGTELLNGTRGTGTETQEITFSSELPDYVRAGGLIKIGGVFRTIESVDENKVVFDTLVPTSYTTAFLPMAFVVDNTGAEASVWTSGVNTITGDDGDGIAESIKKSGVSATWSASVCSDVLDDGPVDIVCVAMDDAENAGETSTPVMIANRAPRISKVFVATDLNADGKYSEDEFKYSETVNDEVVTKYAYSALDSEGNGQETATLSTNKFAVRNGIVVTMEYVNGQGGQGALSYIAKLGTTEATEPVTGGKTSTLGTVSSVTDGSNVTSTSGFALDNTGITALEGYDPNMEIEGTPSDTESPSYMNISIWDSASGTSGAVADTKEGETITKFGNQFTVLNIPFYLDLADGTKPSSVIDDLTITNVLESDAKKMGHIDVSGISGETGTDAKVSGEIYFTGTVSDNHLVKTLKLSIDKLESTAVTVATYSDGSLVFDSAYGESAYSTNGWYITKESETFTQSDGHVVNWKLVLNSAKVEGVAASDIKVTVTADDGASRTDIDNPSETNAETQIDVVPYITGITDAENKLYRSRYGQYSVVKDHTLTVEGFNLISSNTSTTDTTSFVEVGSTKVATTVATAGEKFTFVVPENSGELKVTVNGQKNLNSTNDNSQESNQEVMEDNALKFYYDNRYLRVWDIGHFFKDADSDAHKPTLTSDYDGNLFGAWILTGSGQMIVQRGINNTSTKVLQHYDQPAEFSAIGIDTSKSGGDISTLNFNENVGDGGIMNTNGYSHVSNVGGAWGISLVNALNNIDSSDNNKPKVLTIPNNPVTTLDSNWGTSGYSLSSYAMLRDVGKFTTPRTARYGDNMHYAYYDSKDQSLRYQYVKSGSASATYGRNENFTTGSWVLIDGKTSGYDRVHDASHSGVDTSGTYDKVSLTASNVSSNSVTISGAYSSYSGNCGVNIIYTSEAGKQSCLTLNNPTITTSNSNSVISWSGTPYTGPTSGVKVTLYLGESTVVTTGDAQSTAAGKFIGLDLTSGGKPVIAYYDSKNGKLRVAISNSIAPTSKDAWARYDVPGVSGGSHCALKIDTGDKLHIIYRSASNDLMYVEGTLSTTDLAEPTFKTPLLIDDDTTGTYGTISLLNGTTPVVSYLNAEESETGVKFAILREVDKGNGVTENAFDAMVVPTVVGNNVVGENLVSVTANNGHWGTNVSEGGVDSGDTGSQTAISMTDVDSVVGYQSTRFDVVFLKKEK